MRATTELWLSARKRFKEGAKDNRPLFLKQLAIVSIVLSIVFENFRGQMPFRWAKVVLGGAPR